MDKKALAVTEVAVKGESGHVVLNRGEIRDLLKEGNLAAMFKYALHERSLPEGIGEPERVFNVGEQGGVLLDTRPKAESIISSSMPDRDDDVMVQQGLVITENYTKNSTVFGLHSHDFAVGFTELIEQYKEYSWARWQWTTESEHTEGQKYYEMWKGHIMNCTSVGFMINDWEPIDPDNFWGGWNIKEWELLEHSPVSLPSNREAMRTDGMKALFRSYVESVYEGPSPILRKWFEEIDHEGMPVQVPVSIHLAGEKDIRQAIRDGVADALKEGGGAKVEMTCTTAVKAAGECTSDESEPKTFEQIRLAAAAGALEVDAAFEMIGDLINENRSAIAEKDTALAAATDRIHELESEILDLSAEVVESLG